MTNSQQYKSYTSVGTRSNRVDDVHAEEMSAANAPQADEDVARKKEVDDHTADSDAHHARYSDEEVRDVVAALLAGGTNISLVNDDAGDTLTVNTSALTEEEVEDAVAALISAGSGISVAYDDAGDTLTVSLANDISLNTVSVSDFLSIPPQDVRALSTPSEGDVSYHDGTNGNTVGPAHYDGADWVSIVDGTVIA